MALQECQRKRRFVAEEEVLQCHDDLEEQKEELIELKVPLGLLVGPMVHAWGLWGLQQLHPTPECKPPCIEIAAGPYDARDTP